MSTQSILRILIVADNTNVRRRFKWILASESTKACGLGMRELWIVGEAADTARMSAMLEENPLWDVVILNLPDQDGYELLDELRRRFPYLKVLLQTSARELEFEVGAFRRGASGFLHDQATPETITDAVRTILADRWYGSDSLIQKLLSDLRDDAGPPHHETLTERERQVGRLIRAKPERKLQRN